MNIYHQVLLIFFSLAISTDEAVVQSTDVPDLLDELDDPEFSGSYEKFHDALLREGGFSDSSSSKSGDSREKYSHEGSESVYSNEGSKSEKSNEGSASGNSNEGSSSENSKEGSASKNSNEHSGNENVNEISGNNDANEITGSKNSIEEKNSKCSHEENESKNADHGTTCHDSNEVSRSENSSKKKKSGKKSNKKNKSKNSDEMIKNDNSFEENDNENENEKNGHKDHTDDKRFTVITFNDGENPEVENESGYTVVTSLVGNPVEGKETKSPIPMKYLYTANDFREAKLFEYPYHVAIVWKPDGRLLCQGALIKPGWIITSASCINHYGFHYKTLSVLMGVRRLQDTSVVSRDILEIVLYPDFNAEKSLNDLALLMLKGNVNFFSLNLEPVALSKPYYPYRKKCQFTTFIGNTLYGKSVDYVFPENCDVLEIQGQTLPYFCASVNGSIIKSSKRSTFGSPLVCGGVIYGIKAKNTLFSSVDTLLPWIDEMIRFVTDKYKE